MAKQHVILIAILLATLIHSVANQALAQEHLSDTSAIAMAPEATPTYISELGPAVSRSPRQAEELPATGAPETPPIPLEKALGLGLAVAGAALIFAALRLNRLIDER
jgi:hypothetical protein